MSARPILRKFPKLRFRVETQQRLTEEVARSKNEERFPAEKASFIMCELELI